MVTLSSTLFAQVAPDSEAAGPLISDWSNHHVVFSRPATAEQAERLQRDPRYRQQLARQAPARFAGEETGGALLPELQLDANPPIAGGNQDLGQDWSQDMGTGATVGATNYPAKYSFNTTTASCANDFVIYGTGLAGGTGQATIVAFNNLYSGCTGTVPSVYWAYNTGGTMVTSPAFSQDGTQVAFVQSGGGFKSTLVILKWAASTTETITSPTTLTRTLVGQYPTCVVPCMTTLSLLNGLGAHDKDSNSSIFIDYSNNAAYVGDDDGWLHKFKPFSGVPAQVLTGGFPVLLNPGAPTALTSPIHDFETGNVFVADQGGFLYEVSAVTAGVTISGQLDFSEEFDSGPGIVQGPIVDSTGGLVYVFAPSDGSFGCPGAADCTAVYQLTNTFAAGDVGSEAVVGSSTVEPATPNPLYIGAFDSAYENSTEPPTGNLYVCGNTGGSPVLYQIPISLGSMGSPNAGPLLSTTSSIPCSPVTDILNPNAVGGPTEWMFASAENGGVATICASGGCIFHFKDTPWQPLTVYTVGQEILDDHFQIQVVSVPGTSGTQAPVWMTTPGAVTKDQNVRWVDQGVQSALPLPAWIPSHVYAKGAEILDANGNIEVVTAFTTHTATCTSGASVTFSMVVGATTTDNTCKWTNVGALATAAMPVAGGSSGIIMDNTVGAGTLAGASQVYFSTLSNQTCGTSGTGGCAVQASQAALK
jgi:hypothetical protein